MKLFVKEHQKLEEPEVHILCDHRDQEVEELISRVQEKPQRIIVQDQKKRLVPLEIEEILYIETVEKKQFFYSKSELYENTMKLYELEELLPQKKYLRISKSVIVNLAKIKAIEPEEGRRLKLTLESGEKVMISRSYVKSFKQIIGIR